MSSESADPASRPWWESGVIYQIYPRSFQDSDGDGVGNVCDNCANNANADQADSDGDGVGDLCDSAPAVVNPDQPGANPNTTAVADQAQTENAPAATSCGAGACGSGTAAMTALTAPLILFGRSRASSKRGGRRC